jgi:hypothetical protein
MEYEDTYIAVWSMRTHMEYEDTYIAVWRGGHIFTVNIGV